MASIQYRNRVSDSVAEKFIYWVTDVVDDVGAEYPGPGDFGVDTSDYSFSTMFGADPVAELTPGVLNGSVIEFDGAAGSAHKYTVAGAGPYEIQILTPIDAHAYNVLIINTSGATLTLNAKFLTFPDAQVPAADAASRTIISALYDATLDVFHTSLATR